MKLKRLSLHGFKSFADRTDFEFDVGLTGIIGPNGCGKSNVVDAMKWVLGDQRPTSQRGAEMMDVVFHGAEGRPGMGYAEVQLVLEREPREIGEDAAQAQRVEMLVGRRLFRTGESEYLIDNQPVRLKDVREALMDTGLGVGGYSVMEQGRIDAVLSQNPEERRAIFDEAAGISRYKLRRKEALKKLEKTEQNLGRVKDLRQEKASRVRSLKIQATKARGWREAEDRLRALGVALAMLESIELRSQLETTGLDLETAGDQVRSLEARKDEVKHAVAAIEEETRVLQGEQADLRQQAASLRAEERSRREAVETARERVQGLGELVQRSREEGARVRDSATANETERAHVAARHAELKLAAEQVGEELPAAAEKARAVRASCKETQRLLERVRVEILDVLHERTRAKNRVRDEELALQANAARQARLAATIAELRRKLEASRTEGAEESRVEQDLRERRVRVVDRLAAQVESILSGERSRDGVVRRRHDLASERSAKASQLALLDELEASHTGLEQAARDLLSGHDPNESGIVGRLVEYLDCPLEIGPAVEAVLGLRVQALVVTDFARVRSALEMLAQRKGGRLVLVDLPQAPAASGAEPLPASLDELRTADDGLPLGRFVRCRGPVVGLLDQLFEGVVLVRDLDQAARLRAESHGARRLFVTLRGELVDGAWVSGGAAEVAAGLVQRRSQRDRLQADLQIIERGLGVAAEEEAALAAVLGRQAAHRRRLEALAEALLRRQTALEHKLAARASREAELQEELLVDERELAELHQEKSACLARMMQPLFDTLLLERKEARLTEEQKRLDAEVHEQDRHLHEAQLVLSELQSRQAKLDAELSGLVERQSLLERAGRDLEARTQALLRDAEAAEAERTALEGEIARWQTEQAALGQGALELEARLAALAERLDGLVARALAERQGAESLDAQLLEAREARGQLQVRATECSLKLLRVDEDVFERWRVELGRLRGEIEGYGLWLPAEPQGPSLPAWGEVRDQVLNGSVQGPLLPADWYDAERMLPRLWETADFDREGAAREVELLKARQQRIGPVNLEAEAELLATEAEFDQLERDCQDLEAARKELYETIHRINVESRVRFEQTFEQVRGNFQEIFRKLFQGGRADIQLIESDDPLDAGIEIVARPPGKEMRSIRLLSGGERSLTALAILFSVFKIRPSPFCILDEVDAALDEANVERFLRVLGDFVAQTQFLVVTHHKRTMAECRVLYGVTMPRKGISSRMSVSLDQVTSGEVDRIVGPTGENGGDTRRLPPPTPPRIAGIESAERSAN